VIEIRQLLDKKAIECFYISSITKNVVRRPSKMIQSILRTRMAQKPPKSEFNMSQVIRNLLKDNPKIGGNEAAAAIQAQYPSLNLNKNSFSVAFYTTRQKMGLKLAKRGKRMTTRKSSAAPKSPVTPQRAVGSVDLALLQATAKFLSDVGGADAALEAIKHVQAIQVK
jgi:hypothetical protein